MELFFSFSLNTEMMANIIVQNENAEKRHSKWGSDMVQMVQDQMLLIKKNQTIRAKQTARNKPSKND